MTSGMVLDLRGGGGDAIPQGIHVDRKDYISLKPLRFVGGDALPILVLGLLSLQIYYNRYFPASEHNDIGESMGRYVSRIRENSGSTMEKFTRWLFCWSNWEDCPLGKPNISMAKEDQSVEHRGRQDRGYDSKRQDFRGQDQRFTGRNGNDRQGQGQRRSNETLPPPPLCTTCGKPHPGVCYKATGGCFTCGSTQHKVKDCPQGKQKQSMPRVLLDTSYYMTVLSTTRDQAAKTSEFADVYFPMNFQASANGIIIDHQRFEANTKWPRPTTVTEVEFEEIETRLVSAPILTLPSEFRREVVELLKDYDKHPVPSRARLCVAGALSQKSVDEACFDSIILHELERLDVELCVRGLRKLGELVLSSYSIFILKPMVRSERTIQTLEIFEGCVLWNGQAHQRSLMRKWLVLREIGNEARSRQKSYADKHRRDLEFQVGDRGISEGFAIQEELNDLDKGQAQSSDSTVPFENIGTYLRGFVSSGSSTHLSATFRCALPSNTQPNPQGNNSKAYQPLQSRNELVNVSVGIAENMLVEVGKFTFPADFIILKMEEDNKVPLILGRPFLHTVDAVIRVKHKQLNFGVGTERMIFNIDSAIKHSYSKDDTCFSIDVIDEILEEDFDALIDEGSKILHFIEGTVLEEEIFSEFDKFIAMTADEIYDSESNTEEPPFETITINTDYKIKTSLEEPPTNLELKPLPDNLEYIFLEEPSLLPVIISAQLSAQNKTTFQRCMLAIFHDMIDESVEVFMDDFYVFRNYIDKCLNNLDKMLQHCKDAHLVLNWEKCHFMVKEGIVLEHKDMPVGDSFDKCLNNLDKMLQRCKDAHLVLNWEKCHFMVKEGIVLGHKVSGAGLEVDKAKIDVISKLPPPTNIKGVRSFLGHAGFYRRFIKDFSKIARPLTKLLEKDTPFEFNDECQKAFELLKEKLTCAPVIISPNWNLPFELMCDASDFAVGAVLGFDIEIKDRKGTKNVAADHLSQIENEEISDDSEVDDNFPGETLMEINKPN
ncbi:reverse transcriptase domain-containing protein [Tanacetum coccineum]